MLWVIIILLLAGNAEARGVSAIGMGGGTIVTNCPAGTYEIGYNGDHAAGATHVCYSGTSEPATTNTAAAVTTSYVTNDTANEYLGFTVTGNVSAALDSSGSLFFSAYQVAGVDINTNALIELSYGTNDKIHCSFLDAGTKLICYHKGNSASDSLSSPALAINTWYRCGFSWDVTGTDLALDCVDVGAVLWTSNGGSPDAEDNLATIDSFTGGSDPTDFCIGENFGNIAVTDTVYVKDAYVVTGYKATDPGTL